MRRDIPEPNYDYDINILVDSYKKAILDLKQYIERTDVTNLSRAQARVVLSNVVDRLNEVTEEGYKWVEEHIPKVATEGVVASLMSLGVVDSLQEAKNIAKLNNLNKTLVETMIADTQEDLLQVTQKMSKRFKVAMRQATAESFRENYAKNINGVPTIRTDIKRRLKDDLVSSVEKGVIYADGRKVSLHDYVDAVVRTKSMDAFNEAHTNESVSREAYYAIISSHGAKDACSFHEGRIVKLIESAPGDYTTLSELQGSGQIFHIRCKHSFSSMRDPDLLPESIKSKAESQAELGSKAIATGKRNPKDTDL
ncbi:phage minor capsid protein [Alkalihalobacillus macyae]|uniref:phage minor capsid protein n=1 Tax=Guptibacillus hwajinpoensis TaxID=208199 RepID=UPI00273B4FBC|nr:phage minor capsid protein [Alkalihalobacillus macyae]MDP4549839.1 phage minor capsid protein [Alkalihalobacillus macyae]